jgi:hypothetical protein
MGKRAGRKLTRKVKVRRRWAEIRETIIEGARKGKNPTKTARRVAMRLHMDPDLLCEMVPLDTLKVNAPRIKEISS